MIKQRFFKTDVFSMGYSDKWHISRGVLYGRKQ